MKKDYLQIVGIKGTKCSLEDVERVLKERKNKWQPKEEKYKSGILKIFHNMQFYQ